MSFNTKHRAVDLFTVAANQTVADCRKIAAEHSARGILASGATAKRGVKAFEARGSEALGQMLDELSRRVQHRGKAWKAGLADVEEALVDYNDSAWEILGPTFKLAQTDTGSAREAVVGILEWTRRDLHKQFSAFRDGWTAPPGKPWRERNPTVYAVALLVLGAALGQAAALVGKHLTPEPSAAKSAPVIAP